MILKLIENKIIVETMFVPELKEHTYVEYIFEPNTKHLHPTLYINGVLFRGHKTFINFNTFDLSRILNLKVELLDDQEKVVRSYQAELAYNEYQILGLKPIRPDIEDYLYKLEEEIRNLKQEIIVLKETHLEETNRLNKIITDLEEKGEIV